MSTFNLAIDEGLVMKKGLERKIPLGVLMIAYIMMLFLTAASSGQTPCGKGDQNCGQGWDLPMEGLGTSMLASSINSNLASGINALNIADIAFDFENQSASGEVQNIVTGNDTPAIIMLAPKDTDNPRLSYEIVSLPSHGDLIGRAPNLIYMPEQGYTGDDSIVVGVSDGVGGEGTISIDIGIIELYHPPQVRIRSPLNGDLFTIYPGDTKAQVPVRVTVAGEMESQTVKLYDDLDEIGSSSCTGNNGYCSITFNEEFSAGPHTLMAKATDKQGKTCSSTPVVIIVNPPEPQVEITSPYDGQIFTIPKNITIEAYINDSNPVTNVTFFANGRKIGEDVNGPPYSFVWTDAAAGAYNLVVMAKDSESNMAVSKSVLIIVLPLKTLAKSDLAITLSASSNPAPAGGLMNYMLTVTNRGPDSATDVKVQDYLPPEMEYVSSEASQGDYDREIWSVGDITKYESAKLVITVRTTAEVPPKQIANSAYVFGAQVDPYNYNNHATIYTKVVASESTAQQPSENDSQRSFNRAQEGLAEDTARVYPG
jgi:uncharacterized repeat protein (TIGR01451 family)